jgi:hypothetical protein
MAVLKTGYNSDNTVRTETRSVEQTSVSKTHKIIKSTDSDLPSGILWIGTDGDLQNGVWEIEGVFYAMILTFETTLEQVRDSKAKQIIQSAESKIGAISVLDDDFAEQRQTIKGELEAKQLELATAITIQDAESVVV